jgi:hypothetical protein
MPGKTPMVLKIVLALALAFVFVFIEANAWSSPQPDREEDEIFGAVLREVADRMVDESLRAAGGVACLSIDPGGAPQSVSKEFLEGFGSRPVRRGAECERRPDGAVELATDRPAILITAGPIDWVAEDEVWVSVEYFRTALESALRVYRVVREKSRWVCLGQIIQMAPA